MISSVKDLFTKFRKFYLYPWIRFQPIGGCDFIKCSLDFIIELIETLHAFRETITKQPQLFAGLLPELKMIAVQHLSGESPSMQERPECGQRRFTLKHRFDGFLVII